jgi:hypothetical protein
VGEGEWERERDRERERERERERKKERKKEREREREKERERELSRTAAAGWTLGLEAAVKRRPSPDQGCQIFLGTAYQNGKKHIPKCQQNIPKGHKICIPNGPKIYQTAEKR